MNGKRVFRGFFWVIGGIVFTAAIALLFGLALMILWNWIMPDIFGVNEVTYWQAWGLVLLAHILFRGGRGGKWRPKHGHKDGDWESKFKDRMRSKFGDSGPGRGHWGHEDKSTTPETSGEDEPSEVL